MLGLNLKAQPMLRMNEQLVIILTVGRAFCVASEFKNCKWITIFMRTIAIVTLNFQVCLLFKPWVLQKLVSPMLLMPLYGNVCKWPCHLHGWDREWVNKKLEMYSNSHLFSYLKLFEEWVFSDFSYTFILWLGWE